MTRVRAQLLMGSLVFAIGCGSSPETPTPPPPNLTAPSPQTPANDQQLDTLRPDLRVINGTSTGTGARTYEFQISDREDVSTTLVTQSGIVEGTAGTTTYTPAADLPVAARLYWRARFTEGTTTSTWSAVAMFRTKIIGYNRPGELYDPLIHGETIGSPSGAITYEGQQGLRIGNAQSWVRYQLPTTLTSGEISVEVQGLQANGAGGKARIFSMMDAAPNLFRSKFLFNVQYRGVAGNPDNAVSYKVLYGDSDYQYEPDFAARAGGVRHLNPGATYLWTATWGSAFRLVIREGGPGGPVIYDRSEATPRGTYNPTPHAVYLGANDAADESGSYAGAIYRNLWVGNRPRPTVVGSALR